MDMIKLQPITGDVITSSETDFVAAFKDVQAQYKARSKGYLSYPISSVAFSGRGLDYLRLHFENLPLCSPTTVFTGSLKEHIMNNLQTNLRGPAWGIAPPIDAG